MTFLFHQTFYKNCIPINPDQCSFMILGVKNELQTDFASNNFTIKNSKEENVLEITFDNKLNISTHLTSSTKQANIKLNALNRVQKCMAPEGFPGIARNARNHGNDGKFQKSHQILSQI